MPLERGSRGSWRTSRYQAGAAMQRSGNRGVAEQMDITGHRSQDPDHRELNKVLAGRCILYRAPTSCV